MNAKIHGMIENLRVIARNEAANLEEEYIEMGEEYPYHDADDGYNYAVTTIAEQLTEVLANSETDSDEEVISKVFLAVEQLVLRKVS